MNRIRPLVPVLAVTAVLLVGCGGDSPSKPKEPMGDMAPDFALSDVNPNSATYDSTLSPRDYLGKVSAWYFGHATWGYCVSQFGRLNQMQADLAGSGGSHEIRILGINGIGLESGNPNMVSGRTIPWLQDTVSQQVWSSWKVTYRDVVVLDADNQVAGVYNLTEHDLNISANYDSLKALLERVAK